MIPDFRHALAAQRIRFGEGIRGEVAEESSRFGPAFVVASSDRGGVATEVADLLGASEEERFFGAAPHTPVEVTEAALRRLVRSRTACVVSVGGGSATGLAKALAHRTGLPVIAVPTTYAGSECTSILGQTDGGRKWTLRDEAVRPVAVVYDVALTSGLSPRTSGASGCNALAHAVEALWSPDASPVVGLFAGEAVRLLAGALPAVVGAGDDVRARRAVLYGAYLAGTCLGACQMGLHHRICHVLGGRFDLPHAETHAVILPHVVAFHGAGPPAERLAAALGCDPVAVAGALFTLRGRLGLPGSLRELGLPEGGAEEAADLVLAGGVPASAPVGRDELLGLLARAAAGEPPGHV